MAYLVIGIVFIVAGNAGLLRAFLRPEQAYRWTVYIAGFVTACIGWALVFRGIEYLTGSTS
jgi:uncharacterized membrane protein HdeD (DUF308 family)